MIRVHDEKIIVTIDVEGPATMMESAAVSEAVRARIARGVRTVRLDLRDCTTMDSTFSGTLLALLRQLEKVDGALALVSPSPRVVELLEQMGIADFYAIEHEDRVEGPWSVLTPRSPRVEKLQRHVFEAHDELARLPIPQAPAFRGVAEELRGGAPDSSAETRKCAQPDESGRGEPESMRTAGHSFARTAHLD